MKVEARRTGEALRALILVAESKEESALLDEAFGNKVGDDGLIGRTECQCRLSDGHGEHYVYVPVAH